MDLQFQRFLHSFTLAISIVLVAIGVAIYMDVKLVNMPMEGMTLAISDCFPNDNSTKLKLLWTVLL